jgi:hypothetical protein
VERSDRLWLALSLDQRQTDLLWGRMSGAVGAALFVVEAIAGVFSGLGDLGDDLDGESADRAEIGELPLRELSLRVTRTSGNAPVPVGDHCVAEIRRLEGDNDCLATVVCGPRVLYGGDEESYFDCAIEDERHVLGADDMTTDEDGDAAITVSTPAGIFVISDDATGPFGEYEIEAQIENVH